MWIKKKKGFELFQPLKANIVKIFRHSRGLSGFLQPTQTVLILICRLLHRWNSENRSVWLFENNLFPPSALPLSFHSGPQLDNFCYLQKQQNDKRNIKADESDRLTKCHFHCSPLKREGFGSFQVCLKNNTHTVHVHSKSNDSRSVQKVTWTFIYSFRSTSVLSTKFPLSYFQLSWTWKEAISCLKHQRWSLTSALDLIYSFSLYVSIVLF